MNTAVAATGQAEPTRKIAAGVLAAWPFAHKWEEIGSKRKKPLREAHNHSICSIRDYDNS